MSDICMRPPYTYKRIWKRRVWILGGALLGAGAGLLSTALASLIFQTNPLSFPIGLSIGLIASGGIIVLSVAPEKERHAEVVAFVMENCKKVQAIRDATEARYAELEELKKEDS